jgi:hypothetical protein
VGVALSIGVGTAVLPTIASADGMTLAIGSTGHLVAGVEVTVPITVNCAPLPPPTFNGMTNFQMEEASGKSIARGSGFASSFTCDGSPQAAVVTIIADPAGPPFRRGKAVMTSSFLSFCTQVNFSCESASAGPQLITITR